MHKAFFIRPAKKSDLVHLAEIELAAASLYPNGHIPIELQNQSLEAEILQHAFEQGLLFCAVTKLKNENHINEKNLEEKLLGFASCRTYQNQLHLDEIAVLPKYAKQGIGTQLIQEIKAHCKTLQLQGITLTTFSNLAWNAPFYEKLGFHILKNKKTSAYLKDILMEENFLGLKNRVAMFYENK